jgi:hypothetical protein
VSVLAGSFATLGRSEGRVSLLHTSFQSIAGFVVNSLETLAIVVLGTAHASSTTAGRATLGSTWRRTTGSSGKFGGIASVVSETLVSLGLQVLEIGLLTTGSTFGSFRLTRFQALMEIFEGLIALLRSNQGDQG